MHSINIKIILLGISSTLFLEIQAQDKKRPNIILINIDDMGWSDLSGNGSSYYETPNIDKLKDRGIWFSNAYAGCANSAPSRACLLTGKYTPRHGIFTVGNPDRGDARYRKWISVPNRTSLRPDILTLPQVLHDAGYQTCLIGKWHVTEDPMRNGMDINIAGSHMGNPYTYFSPYHLPALKDGFNGEYLTDRLGDEAAHYIKTINTKRPFFLYYSTYAVHTPLQSLQPIIEKYRKKSGNFAHHNPVYAAMVESVDKNVGKVLNAIHESGIENNTLIIFISDNGGVYRISKQTPLRAGKGSFYEGGIRTPMIIYQKGCFEHRVINDIPVMQIDIFPTLLELLDIKREGLLLDGMSLCQLLKGEFRPYRKRALFWHFPAYLEGNNEDTREATDSGYFRTRPVSVIRLGDWKLIQNYENDSIELYNLKNDISEHHNLARKKVKKRKKLFRLLQNWKAKVNAPVPTQLNPKYESKNSAPIVIRTY